jgi:hypothetical protein
MPTIGIHDAVGPHPYEAYFFKSLYAIALVLRQRRYDQMCGPRPEKPQAYSLEYVEDF